jgi:hypothetical protein
MPKSPENLRAEAKRLYDLAVTINDLDERLIQVLRALEVEADAADIERQMGASNSQVQQEGMQRPPPLPQQEQRPAQQQQQIQSDKEDKEE